MSEPSKSRRLAMARRVVSLTVVALFVCVGIGFLCVSRAPGIAATVANPFATPTPRPRDTGVGANCRACHLAYVNSFRDQTHGKTAKFDKGEDATSCDSCHGDPKKHIQDRNSGVVADDITNPIKLTAGQASATCLTCHTRDHEMSRWNGNAHDSKGMNCLTCHNVHHAKSEQNMLSTATIEDTCIACHKDTRKALFQRSNHFFRNENGQRKVTCTSCHDPHGGEGKTMLVGISLNATCYQCHADKRGPFLWEHSPVQENCMTCHTPHGSNNARLLVTRQHQMCQECHINMLARHSTANGFDVFTFNQGCTNCHSQIHGSNHPSGKGLTR